MPITISNERAIETGNYLSLSEFQMIERFKRRFNLSVIAKSDPSTTTQIIVPAKPATNFDIRHFVIPNIFGEVRGTGFQAMDDCSFLATKDMFSVSINLNIVAEWDQNKVVLVGIGFGSKTAIPTIVGELIGENYISRFRQSKAGRGNGREDTYTLTVDLAGKAAVDPAVPGVLAGDYVFPVIWTPESQPVTMEIRDIIMTVSETIA